MMSRDNQIDLVYPLYLDVPMMTSFLAALEDGIAYGSNIKSRRSNQKALMTQGEAGIEVPSIGVLSTLFNLNLRGKIERNKSVGDDEEIELVKKHTEASLFMLLRKSLYESNSITQVAVTDDLEKVKHASLVEITGRIFRSPASLALDTLFRIFSLMGVEFQDEIEVIQPKNSKHIQHQNKKLDPIEQIQSSLGPDGKPNNLFILKLMQRLKDDLTKAMILDVVMQPVDSEDLSVLIGLSSEFLPEGNLENLLSGHFTVLGKVARVLKGTDYISLYQRTKLGSLIESTPEFGEGIDQLQKLLGAVASVKSDVIKSPALQLMPLAIFI
jgi:hypothetical protein